MNEKKRILIVIAFIVVLILSIILLTVFENKKSEKLYNEFLSAFEGEKNTLVYIGRPTCSFCNLLTPSLEDMKTRYNFNYIYINNDKMARKYMLKTMNKLGLTSIGTPYLAIVSNGKIIDTQDEYFDYDMAFDFLQKNEIISKDAKLLLNYIGLDKYKELLNSDEKQVIVVGQSTCTYCIKAKIVLNDIVEENDIDINYLNVSYLTEAEGKEFQSSLDYFSKDWGTPVLFIVKKGEIIDIIEGLSTKENYIKFFKENGVLK